jgi:hypothetical protein
MAALRNLAIGALRLAGRIDVTEATRWAGRSMDRPFTILGLTSLSWNGRAFYTGARALYYPRRPGASP